MLKRLIFPLTLFTVCSLCPHVVSGQDRSRVIRWSKESQFNSKTPTNTKMVDRIDEVEIESITVENQPVIIGESFNASEEWLKNIRFRVKNISSKPIRRFQITLTFPEALPSPQIGYACVGCSQKEKPIFIEPGREFEIVLLGGGQYDWVMRTLAEKNVLSVREAQIHILYVTLADDTLVASDCIRTSDPRNACTQTKR